MSLIDIIFSQVNLPLTVLVIILILYWIATLVSGIDFDLDIDVDIDVDADVEMGAGVESGDMDFHDVANTEVNREDVVGKRRAPLKWWQIVLIYFNFVGLPFMFTFTSWIFIWWIFTALSTVITGSFDNSFGFILMIALMIPSLFVNKLFTTPFKRFFKNLNQDGDLPIDLVGCVAVSQSTIKADKLGSAEIVAEGNHLMINIKSLNGESIHYQDKVLIIKPNKNKTFYYVQTYKN